MATRRPEWTPEQKKAFDSRVTNDGLDVLSAMLMGAGKFLSQNPDNVIARTVNHPIVKATLVTAAQHAQEYREQKAAEAERAARAAQADGVVEGVEEPEAEKR
jgi:hypothetical protein